MTNIQIGELAEKFEVGGRGPGFISDGDKWDPGGDSYGSYQLATKVGTLQGYLTRTDLKYVSEFKGMFIKSKAFNDKWKEIAARDPKGFKQSQFEYVSDISYNKCRAYADKIGMKDTLAINSALFSISNQHGGWKKILDKVDAHTFNDEKATLVLLYKARERYINSLSSLTPQLKQNLVRTRCVQELSDCLKLMGHIAPDSNDDIGSANTNTTDNNNVSPDASQSLWELAKNNPILNKLLEIVTGKS